MSTLIRLLFVQLLTVSCMANADEKLAKLQSKPAGAVLHRGLPTENEAQTHQCKIGIFRKSGTQFVVLTKGNRAFDYSFSDGVFGNVLDTNSRIECRDDTVLVDGKETWTRVPIVETDTRFSSNGVVLAGRLIEPDIAGRNTPLVVYAHGSEESGWIDYVRDPYQMVGRGMSVFVYDKRGTGLSQGVYSQNFPILADDLVAASHEARRLAHGRYGRFGLFGLSQGGWIAPLAAARAKAEFLGIGFGLAVDIAEEDAEQVTKELQERGYGDDVVQKAKIITDITARIVKSSYKDGLDDLDSIKKRFEKEPWLPIIKGAYTGVLLSVPVHQLRRDRIPHLDKLNVDWSQDPMQVLRTVDIPQLWILAQEDRQAPIKQTIERLQSLRRDGKSIQMYLFPNTEHGMLNYEQAADFTRKHTRVAAGFYDLMADWAKGQVGEVYGQAYRK